MSKAPWLVAGAAAVALVAVLVTARPAAGGGHPNPRPGITAEHVLATLDGVYCHCDCSKHAGHRSLLTCFETNHGAYCDICMGEAMVAAQLAARGTSLQEIRAAIDAQFGS